MEKNLEKFCKYSRFHWKESLNFCCDYSAIEIVEKVSNDCCWISGGISHPSYGRIGICIKIHEILLCLFSQEHVLFFFTVLDFLRILFLVISE